MENPGVQPQQETNKPNGLIFLGIVTAAVVIAVLILSVFIDEMGSDYDTFQLAVASITENIGVVICTSSAIMLTIRTA